MQIFFKLGSSEGHLLPQWYLVVGTPVLQPTLFGEQQCLEDHAVGKQTQAGCMLGMYCKPYAVSQLLVIGQVPCKEVRLFTARDPCLRGAHTSPPVLDKLCILCGV